MKNHFKNSSANEKNMQETTGTLPLSKPSHPLDLSRYKFIPPSKMGNNMSFKTQTTKMNITSIQKKPFDDDSEIEKQGKVNIKELVQVKRKSHHYQSLTEPDQLESSKVSSTFTSEPLQELYVNYSTKVVESQQLASPLKANRNFNKKKRNYEIQSTNLKKNIQNSQEQSIGRDDNSISNHLVGHKKMFRSISATKVAFQNPIKQGNTDDIVLMNLKCQKVQRKIHKSRQNISASILPPKINNTIQINCRDDIKQEVSKVEKDHIEKLSQFIQDLKMKEEGFTEEIQILREDNKNLRKKLNKYQELVRNLTQKNRGISDLNQRIKDYEHQTDKKCHEHTLIIDSLKKIICSQKEKIMGLEDKVHKFYPEQDSIISYEEEINSHHMMTDLKPCVLGQSSHPKKAKSDNGSRTKNNIELQTPNFGGCRTHEQTIKRQNEQNCSLSSSYSSLSYQKYLQLSRIEQSAEEAEQSTDRNQKPFQHQKLLNQIDQYLSKWNKSR